MPPVTPEGQTPAMPTPAFVETNGIRMGYYEAGPRDGVPVVLCHGFPELAYSWRYQIRDLAAAGFRAIAPDQRGYGLTGRPGPVEAYDMAHLTGDLAGLLDALGLEKAVFAGHDWGGFVVWQMPLMHPGRVAGVIGLNTPFMPRPPMDPIALMRMAYGEDMYIVFFQKPGEADRLLGADAARTMRFFMRKWTMSIAEFDARPAEERNLALTHALARPESEWPGATFLNSEETRFYAETFARTGFTGGINWYRNFTRNWQMSEGQTQHVSVPALMIMAENDFVLRPALADGIEQYVPDLEKHLVGDCGHWTQQEKPEETSRVMIGWLRKRFG